MLLKKQDSGKVSVHVAVKKTKEGVLREEADKTKSSASGFRSDETGFEMEEIINEELLMMIDYPVIVMFPSKDGVDFLLLALTRRPVEAEPRESEPGKHVELVPAPQVVRKVAPLYPDDLKKEGIGGELKLRITIGKDGKVEDIVVMKSVHPYLDYSAVEAFKDWEFEPVVKKGKATRAAFDYSYLFDLSSGPAMTSESPIVAGNREELDRILTGCAEYCRKRRDEALYFVCEETIDEIHYRLNPDVRRADLYFTWSQIVAESADGREVLSVAADVQVMDPNRTERKNYICDYQLIRKAGIIKERRTILKEDGRKTPDQSKLLDEKRFSMLMPMTICLRILEHDRQSLYDYRIEGESEISGKKAYVLEAKPKPGSGEWIRKARIWVDRQSFQILKSDIEGVPIEE